MALPRRRVPHLAPLAQASGHNQLDHPALVAFCGHGLPQRLHGVLVSFAQKRLSVDGNQLVVDPKPPIL